MLLIAPEINCFSSLVEVKSGLCLILCLMMSNCSAVVCRSQIVRIDFVMYCSTSIWLCVQRKGWALSSYCWQETHLSSSYKFGILRNNLLLVGSSPFHNWMLNLRCRWSSDDVIELLILELCRHVNVAFQCIVAKSFSWKRTLVRLRRRQCASCLVSEIFLHISLMDRSQFI